MKFGKIIRLVAILATFASQLYLTFALSKSHEYNQDLVKDVHKLLDTNRKLLEVNRQLELRLHPPGPLSSSNKAEKL